MSRSKLGKSFPGFSRLSVVIWIRGGRVVNEKVLRAEGCRYRLKLERRLAQVEAIGKIDCPSIGVAK
jgi:hypothetical protein